MATNEHIQRTLLENLGIRTEGVPALRADFDRQRSRSRSRRSHGSFVDICVMSASYWADGGICNHEGTVQSQSSFPTGNARTQMSPHGLEFAED